MNLPALKALINSDSVLSAMPTTPDAAYSIAEALNAPSGTRIASRMVTARLVLAERAAAGAAVLTKLEQIAQQSDAVRWAMRLVSGGGGIDVGHEVTRSLFAQLVQQSALTQSEADTILSMAQVSSSRAMDALGEPVTWGHVLDARSL
jgi:hypothetical protein